MLRPGISNTPAAPPRRRQAHRRLHRLRAALSSADNREAVSLRKEPIVSDASLIKRVDRYQIYHHESRQAKIGANNMAQG